jgi:tape measure domain-containing protein
MAADLEIRIGAELSEIKGALAGLQKDLANVGKGVGTGNPLKGVESGAAGALASVGRLVAGLATLATVLKGIAVADELDTLNARLKIATGSTDEYVRAQQALFEISQRTRSSLNETVDLYSRVAMSVKDAGVGQETLLSVVETVNKAVQLSGASAEAAKAALIQLGQGLASGTLRGDELNSILEQTPALADAIAKGMGITRGELRKYGEEGKITAQQVIKGLQAQREQVDKDFQQLPVTVGQAFTQLQNSGKAIVGAFNDASGATSGLAQVISDFATYLSSDEFLNNAVQLGAIWSSSFKLLIDDAGRAVDIIKNATQNIFGTGQDLISFLGQAFREFPINIRTAIQLVVVDIAAFVDRVIAYATFAKEAAAAIFNDDTIDSAYERFQRRLTAIDQAATESMRASLAERQKVLDDAAKSADAAQAKRDKGRQNTGANGLGNFKVTLTDEQKRKLEQERKARLDADEKALKDSTKRQLTILDQLYEDAKVSIADYYQRRADIELAELDRSIEIERKRAKAGGAEAIKALAEIEILEKQKTDITTKAARDRAKAQKDLDKELQDARIQDLQNQGKTAEAERLRLEQQYRDLIKRLEAESNTAGVDLIKKLIDTGVAKAQFDEIKAQFDDTLKALQNRQEAIANQQKTGGLAPDTAQQQSQQATQDALPRLQALNAEIQKLAADPNALPAVKRAAEDAALALQNMAVDSAVGVEKAMNELRASLKNLQDGFAATAATAGVDAVSGLFMDLASGSKSASDSIRDFARSFAASMAQVAARALATIAVLRIMEAIAPGSSKLLTVSAAVKHSGGMVGAGGVRRSVDPLMFAGAPRYHSGGMVGLKPGEVPAILQIGEEVLSRSDPRNQANGGGGGGAGTRIINVIDPSLVSDYMTSSAGEKTVLNILQRNPGAIRQVLT